MWLFTKHGFYSVVCAHGEPDTVMVRARCQRHLENLRDNFPTMLADCRIIANQGTDYPFRMLVGKEMFSLVARRLVQEIDYINFKSEVASTGDRVYEHCCHEVWRDMLDLQREESR